MKARLLVILLATSVASAFAGAPPDFDEARYKAGIGAFDRNASWVKSAETNLNETEKRMNAIIIPEVDFRQANIFDIIHFYDAVVPTVGAGPETNDSTRIRIKVDKAGLGAKPPCITFACRKLPLLYALRVTANVGGLEYKTEGNIVTVFKPAQEANKVPEDTARKLADSQH